MICDIRGNANFYNNIIFKNFIENDYHVIFAVECTMQRCFLKSEDFETQERTLYILTHISPDKYSVSLQF